jgi:DnaJ-class molecular chaperone
VKLKVVVPTPSSLSAKQKELLEEFAGRRPPSDDGNQGGGSSSGPSNTATASSDKESSDEAKQVRKDAKEKISSSDSMIGQVWKKFKEHIWGANNIHDADPVVGRI